MAMVSNGVLQRPSRRLDQRRYCDACEQGRPSAGFVRYERYTLCKTCATTYALAVARGLAVTPGQYVRDTRFGDTWLYVENT
jgi:hypothetical protein